MQKVSMKKLSVLGLVLLAASAVTAAIVPGKKDKDVKFSGGSLTNQTVGGDSSITCGVDSNDVITDTACNASTNEGSLTTVSGEVTSNNDPSGSNGLGLGQTTTRG